MTEGNQVRRALGGHNSGDTGGGKYVSFGHCAIANGSKGRWGHVNAALGHSLAAGGVLVAHIHH